MTDRPASPAAPKRLPQVDDFPEKGPNALGSFVQRAIARFIDEIVVDVPSYVILFALITNQFGDVTALPDDYRQPIWLVIGAVVFAAAYEIIPVALWGRSPGKWVCGLRVARYTDGDRPTWSQATLRALLPLSAGVATLWVVSFSIWGAAIIYASAFFDTLRRGWHDKAAGTIVVTTR